MPATEHDRYTARMNATPKQIVDFWRHAGPESWFRKSDAFDARIRERFQATHHAAARGELDTWVTTSEGALALLLLLDQFPRNLFRDSPHAWATDGRARAIAHAAIELGHDRRTEPALQNFFYLPFEHSEDLADQRLAVELVQAQATRTGDASLVKWATLHHDLIVRFGRFPHRNAALGRSSTVEELAYLEAGGFAG